MGVLFLWGIFFFSVALLHNAVSAMKLWCYRHLVLGGTAGTSEIGPSVLLWQQTGISWVTVMRICREQKTCPYGICFICSDCRITFLKFLLWFWTEMWKWPCFFFVRNLWETWKFWRSEEKRIHGNVSLNLSSIWITMRKLSVFKKIWGLGGALPSQVNLIPLKYTAFLIPWYTTGCLRLL